MITTCTYDLKYRQLYNLVPEGKENAIDEKIVGDILFAKDQHKQLNDCISECRDKDNVMVCRDEAGRLYLPRSQDEIDEYIDRCNSAILMHAMKYLPYIRALYNSGQLDFMFEDKRRKN